MATGTSGTISGIGRTCSSDISRSTISLASWRASRSSPTCSAKFHDRWVNPRRLSLDAESLMSFMRVSGWADKFSMLSATLANESLRALFNNPWAKRKTAAFRPFRPNLPLFGSSSQWLKWSHCSFSSKSKSMFVSPGWLTTTDFPFFTETEFGIETVARRILGRGRRIFEIRSAAGAARTSPFAEVIQPAFFTLQAVAAQRIFFVLAV